MGLIKQISKKRQDAADSEYNDYLKSTREQQDYPLGRAIDAIQPQQIQPATAQQNAQMYPQLRQPQLPPVQGKQMPLVQAVGQWPTQPGPGDPWAAGAAVAPQQQQQLDDPWAAKVPAKRPDWWYDPGF